MYSRQEEQKIRLDFWQGFDKFGKTDPELKWKKPTWILYKTGIKHLELKFDIESNSAIVALEFGHKNEGRRLDMFEEVERYKAILGDGLPDLIWEFSYFLSNGKEVGRAYIKKEGLNYKREKDRPELYQFMAKNMAILESNFMELRDLLKTNLQKIFNDV